MGAVELRGLGIAAVGWLTLGMASPAAAQCVADDGTTLPQEGRCVGDVLETCVGDQVQLQTCDGCCLWDGNSYECATECPAEGDCVEECLGGADVFGCSLLNTHEWTCAVQADGCTDRLFVACGADEICDESDTNACRPTSEVDLCGGVPAEGKCNGGQFQRCVDGALEKTDCAARGESCVDGQGCSSDCPLACVEGESGCSSAGKAWDCVRDAQTGCLVQAEKSCGAKQCYEGRCRFAAEIERLEREAAARDNVDNGTEADPVEAAAGSDGCSPSSAPTTGWAWVWMAAAYALCWRRRRLGTTVVE